MYVFSTKLGLEFCKGWIGGRQAEPGKQGLLCWLPEGSLRLPLKRALLCLTTNHSLNYTHTHSAYIFPRKPGATLLLSRRILEMASEVCTLALEGSASRLPRFACALVAAASD